MLTLILSSGLALAQDTPEPPPAPSTPAEVKEEAESEKKSKEKSDSSAPEAEQSAAPSKAPAGSSSGIPLISSGVDSQIALLRASAASKREIEALNPVTIIDIAGNHPAILLASSNGQAAKPSPATGCTSTVMSNSRLKMLTQTADNDLAYYELEQAEKRLNDAVKGLVCLQDTLEVDVVQRMYFLQGILDYSVDKPQEATKAFSLAIRFKPDMQWDDNFPPDAMDLFKDAKKSFSKAKEIPLEVTPSSATPNIWINGVALISGGQHFLYEGENIIQVIGNTVQTHKVVVDGSVDKLQLVVPSTMPITANTWVSDEAQRQELDFVLANVLPAQSELLVHNSGDIWSTNVGSSQWQQLEVPKRVENRANAKAISGKVLFWSGVGTVAAGLGYSGYFYLQGLNSANTAKGTTEFGVYESMQNDHASQQANYRIGLVVTGAGVGLGALGYRLSF